MSEPPSKVFTSDIACPRCRYNLRGLSLDRGCPECGLRVAATVLPTLPRHDRAAIEAEIAAVLDQERIEEEREQRIDQLLASWERRGEQFDELLQKLRRAVDRIDKVD